MATSRPFRGQPGGVERSESSLIAHRGAECVVLAVLIHDRRDSIAAEGLKVLDRARMCVSVNQSRKKNAISTIDDLVH